MESHSILKLEGKYTK